MGTLEPSSSREGGGSRGWASGGVPGGRRGHRIHGVTLLEVYCIVALDFQNLTSSLETYECPVQGSEEPAFLITSSKGCEVQLCGF